MNDVDAGPGVLRANCWTGADVEGVVGPDALKWAIVDRDTVPSELLAPKDIDYDDWTHPDVGWGVVLPERDDLDAHAKSVAADAPAAIQELVRRRGGAPVLRYTPALAARGLLRRYERGGGSTEPGPRGDRGTAAGQIPHYLLIVASPAEIPWNFQYRLQTEAFVGRLDLDAAGLENYVGALLDDWKRSRRDVGKPVVWSVDHGHPDMTRLMRRTIADRLANAFQRDPEFADPGLYLSDGAATAGKLVEAIRRRRPAFIATTSHGATYPLDDPITLAGQLGALVDADHSLLGPKNLPTDWEAEGAIWYAHACCSAGASRVSAFQGLLSESSTLGRTVQSLGQAGEISATLPKALLGHARPLGAFIGHVEPTFNWTLYDAGNQETTTSHIVRTLYNLLHASARPTVGRALKQYYGYVASLLLQHHDAIAALQRHAPGAPDLAIRTKLVATDLLSMVLLGDPTVRLPHSQT